MAVPQDRVILLGLERHVERLDDAVQQHAEDIAGDSALVVTVAERVADLENQVEELAKALKETVDLLTTALKGIQVLTEDQEATEKMLLTILGRLRRG